LSRVNAGAWGPSVVGDPNGQPIGNRSVKVLNNILYNPSGFSVGDQHFAIYGPQIPTTAGIPSPQRSDVDLEIKGNLIWNGSSSHPLGIEDANQGCQPSNTTCNEVQLRVDNFINVVEPELLAPERNDFRPKGGSTILSLVPAPLTAFIPRAGSETTPEGILTNSFTRDRSGAESSPRPIGAYSGSSIPELSSAPTISSLSARYSPVTGGYRLSLSFVVTSVNSLRSVSARLSDGTSIRVRRRRGSRYTGALLLESRQQRSVVVVARDTSGLTTRKKVRINASDL
jgi:hypothetical protein